MFRKPRQPSSVEVAHNELQEAVLALRVARQELDYSNTENFDVLNLRVTQAENNLDAVVRRWKNMSS